VRPCRELDWDHRLFRHHRAVRKQLRHVWLSSTNSEGAHSLVDSDGPWGTDLGPEHQSLWWRSSSAGSQLLPSEQSAWPDAWTVPFTRPIPQLGNTWFPWLFVSRNEMRLLVKGTGWHLSRVLGGTPRDAYVGVFGAGLSQCGELPATIEYDTSRWAGFGWNSVDNSSLSRTMNRCSEARPSFTVSGPTAPQKASRAQYLMRLKRPGVGGLAS